MPLRSLALMMLFVAALGLPAASLHAQGGPPMLTDDPGTPGDGKWEINIAASVEHGGDTTTYALPVIDANYGIGERIQLNFQVPWLLQRVRGERDASGLGNGQIALKWRFFDAGEDGWQVSMYPRVEARLPATSSALSEPGVSYLLPFEFARKLGDFGLNVEVGRWLHARPEDDTWIGGFAVGRELRKGWELIAELHEEHDVHSGREQLTVNFGSRLDVNEHCKLLAALGSDLHSGIEPRQTLLGYIGVQLNF